jgi:pimeloyl-ACP methyl ester carboxylesterase
MKKDREMTSYYEGNSKFILMLKKYFKLIFKILLFCSPLLLLIDCKMRMSDSTAKKEFEKDKIKYTIKNIVENNHTIHYVQTGNDSGPTLVFVHGSPGSWQDFKTYLKDPDLIKKYRLISIDRPGFGYSDYGTGLHLQDNGDIIGHALKTLYNNKPMYLIGHSYGGPAIALLAADYPEKINGIVVLAGALDPAIEPKEKWRKGFIHAPLKYLLPGAFRPSNQELWYLKTDLIPFQNKLKQITCDVYIMHAKNDMLVDPRNPAYMKKEMVNATFIKDTMFPEGNHFIPWNHYKDVKALLMLLQ